MQVAGQHEFSVLNLMATGARVSNAYPAFPCPRDSPSKGGLIPYEVTCGHLSVTKGFADMDGDASD